MAITTDEFVTGFHSICGTTIAERRKSLFLFLNGIKPTHSNNLDFSQLRPKTPLEEKCKIEALIYFRRTPDLLEVLKSEDPVLIKRVLKVPWFLEEGFQNIAGEELVTLIFPQISFNAKQKLLNKLVVHLKNTQADAYFAAVEKQYGFYLASKLLSACSPDVVVNCLKFKRIKLTPKQLLAIVKKNPGITESILKIINDKNISLGQEYKNVFLYLAQSDIQLFWKLYLKYNLSLSLGWRKTHKFILANRKDVIDNPNKYFSLLHTKQISKTLNRDFDQLYRNLFPESLMQLWSGNKVFYISEKLHKKVGNYNLLFTTFEKVYGSHLWDHEGYRSMRIFKMLPPNERESKSALEYKPKRTSEEEWYCYMKTEISIPYLLKKISLTSNMKARAELVPLLPKTCYINDDKKALLNICKYMLKTHRNDNASVRRAFLAELKDKFALQHLDEEHWITINEFIQLFTLNKESFDDAAYFFERYIHSCLIRGSSVKELLTEWLKTHHTLSIISTQPQYEKQCLLTFGEIISESFREKKEKEDGKQGEDPTEEEQEEDKLYGKYVETLISWNRRHPEDPISMFSYAFVLSYVERNIAKENDQSVVAHVIKHCLPLKTNSKERSYLINLYIQKSASYVDENIIKWLVQNEPLIIIENIDVVALFAVEKRYHYADDSFMWKWWRNHTHLENFQNAINICLAEFEKNVKECSAGSNVRRALAGLSYLMEGEQFKKIIEPYYPRGLRSDAKNKENETLYTIQKHIGPLLRNLKPFSLALESLSIFCKGDYLKLVQKSLYSVCSNVNESKLIPFFDELAGRAVSTRKHALHLSFRVLNKEQMYKLLNRFMETEKNASVRKFIFKGAFNFFVLNADDYTWEMLKLNANAIDVNDKEALKILMESDKIPLQYIAPYIAFTWGVLNKLPDSDSDKECNRRNLLSLITADVVHLFPNEFCKDLLLYLCHSGRF